MSHQDFWEGKRVLVTGHTGFKGSWLTLWLKALGAEVIGFALPPDGGRSMFTDARVGEGITSVYGDIADPDPVCGVVADHRPDVVIHLAAQSLVRQSLREPAETYRTNILGTVNLLEAVRVIGGARVVVNVTSDKCYKNHEWEWPYRENDVLGGRDPYSSSKACSELVTSAYRDSFFALKGSGGPRVATARAGNVIGGGDWSSDRLVPDVFRAAIDGGAVRVRHPMAVRPWQHVMDALDGYLTLASQLWDRPEAAGAWNFGPQGDGRSVIWVLERLRALWVGRLEWELQPPTSSHVEAGRLALDSSRSRALLGWRPRWRIDDALASTVRWYQAYAAGANVGQTTHDEISAFEAAATSGFDSY